VVKLGTRSDDGFGFFDGQFDFNCFVVLNHQRRPWSEELFGFFDGQFDFQVDGFICVHNVLFPFVLAVEVGRGETGLRVVSPPVLDAAVMRHPTAKAEVEGENYHPGEKKISFCKFSGDLIAALPPDVRKCYALPRGA
jgi:hypothetical protein